VAAVLEHPLDLRRQVNDLEIGKIRLRAVDPNSAIRSTPKSRRRAGK
jgi:hypothetical protein